MNNLWIFLAFASMFISGFSVITLKLIDKSNYNNILFLLLTYIFMGIFAFCYILQDKKMKTNFYNSCDKKLFMFTIAFAILLIFNNIVMQKAVSNSPNTSYTHIIVNLNILITLLAGYFLFKERFNLRCLFGIFLCLLGIIIITYYSNN